MRSPVAKNSDLNQNRVKRVKPVLSFKTKTIHWVFKLINEKDSMSYGMINDSNKYICNLLPATYTLI